MMAAEVETGGTSDAELRPILLASVVGTLFEWYDFSLFAVLSVVIGAHFFASVSPDYQTVFALLTFGAGFVVRPLGAVVFGRFADTRGRKASFVATVTLMGGATFLVGLLPGQATLGLAAPVLLVLLRFLQGFAMGGEYGGAAVFLAEHVPAGRRGLYTSLLQGTITAAFVATLLLLLGLRGLLGEAAFADWGWRIPFLLSIVPLVVSVRIRLRLSESPVFLRMRCEGTASSAPLTDVVRHRGTLRLMLLSLFGLVAGQAVLGYGGQLYPFILMQTVLRVDAFSATVFSVWAMTLCSLTYPLFGWLSDRVGRKAVVLAGLIGAMLALLPLFSALIHLANPGIAAAQSRPIVVAAPAETCSLQFNPTGVVRYTSDCDTARALLARLGFSYRLEAVPPGAATTLIVGSQRVAAADPALRQRFEAALAASGGAVPPASSALVALHLFDIASVRALGVIAVLTLLGLFGAMVYAPMAAYLVELMPRATRATALSLPYNIGNGWIGGLLPATAFALVLHTGNPLAGVWYCVAIAALSAVVTAISLPETRGRPLA